MMPNRLFGADLCVSHVRGATALGCSVRVALAGHPGEHVGCSVAGAMRQTQGLAPGTAEGVAPLWPDMRLCLVH